MTELDDDLQARLKDLSDEGDELAEDGDYEAALARYWQAFELLPEPKTDWEAGTWLLTAIGDAHFLRGSFERGRDGLAAAMRFPDAIGNPFLHLRLGQCLFELGDRDRAADELMRAYMGDGAEIFAEEDPKYLQFLATRAKDIALPKKKPFWKVW